MKIRQTFPIKLSFISIFILFMLFTIGAFNSQDNSPQFANFSDLGGPYLGQKPPGIIPEIFALGYISTEGMIAASEQPSSRLCTACFDGNYPIALPSDAIGKNILETALVSTDNRSHKNDNASALSRP